MIKRSLKIQFILVFAVIIVSICFSGCSQEAQQASAPPPTEVTIARPLVESIVDWDEYTGRFEARQQVDVRARVSGFLEEIRFEDGDEVEEGQILFVLDKRPFQFAFDEAMGRYKAAESVLENATREYERAEGLYDAESISQESFDEREQALLAAAAQLQIAKSAVDAAKLNLEFTEVKAPIKGRVGRHLVSVGNLINGGDANSSLLTTIVTLNPIYFYFEASEADLLKYSRMNQSGSRPGSRNTANPLKVRLLDEEEYVREGRMDFVDNVVDIDTGTIQGRAVFENDDALIEPGMFGRARLLGSGEYEALLIPDAAIGTNQAQKFVYVVNDTNTAVTRPVRLGNLQPGNMRVITDGLTHEDKVIVKGVRKIRPGAPVSPTEVALGEEGGEL